MKEHLKHNYSKRIKALISLMQKGDAFLLTNPASIRYFSGMKINEPDAIVLIPFTGKCAIISDGRYRTQIEEEVDLRIFNMFVENSSYVKTLKEKFPSVGSRLFIEQNSLFAGRLFEMKYLWPETEIIPASYMPLNIRAIKSDFEIDLIKKAIRITEEALKEAIKIIKVGVSENDIAAEISYRQKKFGAEKDGFNLQILTGDHSALPHGKASNRKIKKGDLIQFDIGCVYEGYHSDISRVVIADASKVKHMEIFLAVDEIQKEIISRIKPGVDLRELYILHCNLLKEKGYEAMHSLGHGVGLEIHEYPSLSNSEEKAEINQVFTIEPGIYIPGFGGVRIEDIVRVTPRGCEVLTSFPRNLPII